MTEAEFITFTHDVKYELEYACDQDFLQKMLDKIEKAENIEEVQVAVLEIFKEIKKLKISLKQYFKDHNITFLEAKRIS